MHEATDSGPLSALKPPRNPAMSERRREPVERNYRAFEEKLPGLLASHPDRFALMRDGEVVEIFDTARDAYVVGMMLFKEDPLFSVQQISAVPVDLGFFSHAVPQR